MSVSRARSPTTASEVGAVGDSSMTTSDVMANEYSAYDAENTK